jgi:hypothetical protein
LGTLESEVNNDGFSQYFVNDSAEPASFVVEALEMIGATKTDYLQDGRNHCVSIWITPDQTGYSFGRSGFL